MSLFRTAPVCALLLILASGCRSASTQSSTAAALERPPQSAAIEKSWTATFDTLPANSTIARVSHEEPPSVNERDTATAANDPFAGQSELSLDQLVAEVQQRNPSLEAMQAAWQAASQRYPQAVALEDPMFQSMFAPASIGSSSVDPAYALQLSQKIPLGGKRESRGAAAQAEADAAYHDLEDVRNKLAEATRLAFFDYYLARRELDLNTADSRVMKELRETALARYQANQTAQQDVLQADVDLAELQRRRIEVERMLRVSVARINTLLRRAPQAPLPPPPRRLAQPSPLPAPELLEQTAWDRRPDLAALASRVAAESAAVELACKEKYPDVEVFGRYDTFWQPQSQADLRGQVGVTVNLPVYRGKLNAAINEAMYRLSQRRAELEQRRLDIQFEIHSTREQLEESRRTLQLFADRLLPAATQNVAAARASYGAGSATFLGLAEAERKLVELREKQEEALADYHRRLAALERVVAGPIP